MLMGVKMINTFVNNGTFINANIKRNLNLRLK